MKFLFLVFLVVIIYIFLQALYSLYYSQKSDHLNKTTFTGKRQLGESSKTAFNLFIAGDSVGAGVGASSFETSVSGRLALYFSKDHFVKLENVSVVGNRMKNLINSALPSEKQDLIVLIISSNDLFHFTNLGDFKKQTHEVLSRYSPLTKKLIIIGPGNIADPPPVPLVLKPYYAFIGPKYASEIDEAKKDFPNTYHVSPLNSPINIKDYGYTYASDKFHPNDAGHNYWFNMIKSAF